jgi:hypothetical protein
LNIRSATFRGIREQNGYRLAEVEVQTDQSGDSSLLAYFRQGPKGYQLVRVLQNDAQNEVDWYDNNLHAAFRDVTSSLFRGPGHEGGEDRNAFASQVLEIGDIRSALDQQFGKTTDARVSDLP